MRKLTPAQLRRLHMALDAEKSVSGAARLLGMKTASLESLIKAYPELSSYLPNASPPSEIETIDRDPPAVVTEEEQTAVAIRKSDERVRKGFEAIGVTGKSLEEAMAFRHFGKFFAGDTFHYIGGGIAKLFTDLMSEARETSEAIDPRDDDLEYQRMLREDRSRLVKLCLDTYDRVREASLTAAVIEQKKREVEEAKKNPKKNAPPPLMPVAMKVDGNVTVVTTQKTDEQPAITRPTQQGSGNSSGPEETIP